MSKQPLVNAVAAAAYIALIGSFMFYVPHFIGKVDTVAGPITLISLFTLSAAVMGYIFVLTPIKMYLDGQKKEGVSLFAKSVAYFAVITVLFVIILILTNPASPVSQ